jgi:hypothetical protein
MPGPGISGNQRRLVFPKTGDFAGQPALAFSVLHEQTLISNSFLNVLGAFATWRETSLACPISSFRLKALDAAVRAPQFTFCILPYTTPPSP